MKETTRYQVHKSICDFYGLDLSYPFHDSREWDVVEKRQIFHYLSKKFVRCSLSHIGDYCSIRTYTHATVLSSIRTIENLIQTEPKLKKEIDEIKSNINRVINKFEK